MGAGCARDSGHQLYESGLDECEGAGLASGEVETSHAATGAEAAANVAGS